MTNKVSGVLAALSLGFVCLLAPPRVSAQALRKVVIGVSNADNVTFFPLYYAKDAGYFRDQGIEPQLIVMNSDLANKALLTGDVDYAASTVITTKAAALGFPVKIIMSFFNGTDFSIVAKGEVKTPNDLKGKTIAVSRLVWRRIPTCARRSSISASMPPRMSKSLRWSPLPIRLIALLTGKVDAAIINVAETIRAQEQGMRVLVSTGNIIGKP